MTNKHLHTRCARIKLKVGCLEKTREWFSTLMAEKEEALKILKEQGVYVEAVFLDQINDEYYLIYFMKEESTEKSTEIAAHSTHLLNEKHRQYKKDCWGEKIALEPLLDLDRINIF